MKMAARQCHFKRIDWDAHICRYVIGHYTQVIDLDEHAYLTVGVWIELLDVLVLQRSQDGITRLKTHYSELPLIWTPEMRPLLY